MFGLVKMVRDRNPKEDNLQTLFPSYLTIYIVLLCSVNKREEGRGVSHHMVMDIWIQKNNTKFKVTIYIFWQMTVSPSIFAKQSLWMFIKEKHARCLKTPF